MLSELVLALLPAIAKPLRHLSLGLLSDHQYNPGEATEPARALAEGLAPQITMLRLGACGAGYARGGQRARVRDQLKVLSRAWITAIPPATAEALTVVLRLDGGMLSGPDGQDDGVFAALVPLFKGVGARCTLELGALIYQPLTVD